MPKGKLEFRLPEERREHEAAARSEDLKLALWELWETLVRLEQLETLNLYKGVLEKYGLLDLIQDWPPVSYSIGTTAQG